MTSAIAKRDRLLAEIKGIVATGGRGALKRIKELLAAWQVQPRRATMIPQARQQMPLPIIRVIEVAGERRIVAAPAGKGELFAFDSVPCRLGGWLLLKVCLDRRTDLWPSGKRRNCMRHPECEGCKIGEDYAARSTWHVPRKPTQPAEVLAPEQRKAKAKWMAEHITLPADQDPMAEAASLTPDDDTDWKG